MPFPGLQPSSEFNVTRARVIGRRRRHQRRRKVFGRVHRLLRSETGYPFPALRPHYRLRPVLSTSQEVPPLQRIRRWQEKGKPDNTYHRGGSISVQLTSCLFCLDSAALLMLNRKSFTCSVLSKPVKQEVSRTQILPPMVRVLKVYFHICF